MNGTIVSALALLLFASGCATAGKSDVATVKEGSPTTSVTGNSGQGLSFGTLEDAALPAKKCGMVLWTLEGSRPAAIFRYIAGEQAEMNISGAPVKFERVDHSGVSGFGVHEQQLFRSDTGLEIQVSARFGLEFNGGAYLERGLLKISDREGWSMVAPSAGIAGCRN